jgi:rhamnosyltransferase
MLLDVGFNKEVAGDKAIYWSKNEGSLAGLISKADNMSPQSIKELGDGAKRRMDSLYSWEFIVGEYEKVFSGSIEG